MSDLRCASEIFEDERQGGRYSEARRCAVSKPLWLAAAQRAVSKSSWFDDSTIYTFLFKSS